MGFQGFAYIEGSSAVHRCHAAVKIVLLLVFSIVVLAVPSWWVVCVSAAFTVACMAVARIPVTRMLIPLAPVFVLALFAMVFSIAAEPGMEGACRGAHAALRMILLVAASMVVCLTSTSTELLAGFSMLIGPLRLAKVPVDDIALTLSLAVRFIPVVAEEFASVRRAQEARGGTLSDLSVSRRLRVWGMAFTAVFVGLFRHADVLSDAMDARCYGMSDDKTSLPRSK